MGIMVSKDNDNSELNRRITSDLRQRAQSSDNMIHTDFADQSTYIEGTKKTGRYTWVWVVLIVLAVISLICIAFV